MFVRHVARSDTATTPSRDPFRTVEEGRRAFTTMSTIRNIEASSGRCGRKPADENIKRENQCSVAAVEICEVCLPCHVPFVVDNVRVEVVAAAKQWCRSGKPRGKCNSQKRLANSLPSFFRESVRYVVLCF